MNNDFKTRSRAYHGVALGEHANMLIGQRNLLLIECDAVGADPDVFSQSERENFEKAAEDLRLLTCRLFYVAEMLGRPMRPFEQIAMQAEPVERPE